MAGAIEQNASTTLARRKGPPKCKFTSHNHARRDHTTGCLEAAQSGSRQNRETPSNRAHRLLSDGGASFHATQDRNLQQSSRRQRLFQGGDAYLGGARG